MKILFLKPFEKEQKIPENGKDIMSKVIVIGGGAAGMMAAAAAAGKGHQVELFDKNEKLGKKIYITGKGRCNVTNACDTEDLFKNVVTNPKFLYSAFYGFDNQAAMDFFEKAGCRLKIERGNRVFPVSDHASDVIRALADILEKRKVKVHLRTKVEEIWAEDGKAAGVQLADGTRIHADAVVVATGGLSYPTTGSDGDGYRMARQQGHKVEKCSPSLVPFEIKEEWCKKLQGLALKNVRVSIFFEGKEIYEEFGEMLFTHFGVSGPLILSASSFYGKALDKWKEKQEKAAKKAGREQKQGENSEKAAEGKETNPQTVLYLDLKPALSEEQLDRRILRDFDENKNKQFKNAVDGLFPARLIPVMIQLSGIDPEKKVHDITREERTNFVKLMKKLPMTVEGTRGFSEAIITRGGVKVKEINPSTMESKLVSGLYFAGEVLDIDALTGGFNLQVAWSTGYLAGDSIQ